MIKQMWMFWISMAILAIGLLLALERAIFLARAIETTGAVTHIYSYNTRCGGKRKHNCTKFDATVQYTSTSGASHRIVVSAGSTRGHDQSIANASRRKGEKVGVVYSPSDPERAYENSLWGVWGAPLMAGFVQIATLFGSMSEGRKRRSSWS